VLVPLAAAGLARDHRVAIPDRPRNSGLARKVGLQETLDGRGESHDIVRLRDAGARSGQAERVRRNNHLVDSGTMTEWTLDDIPWSRIDPARVDPDLVAVVKAASLVERNAGDYVTYLCRVFAGDSAFQSAVRTWGTEEERHGLALGRWAEIVDPGFDHEASFQRFRAG